MAFAELKAGDTAIAAKVLKVEMNLTGKEDGYVTVCVNGLDETLSYTTETWTDLCNQGMSSNAATGVDVSWSAEAVLRKDSTAAKLAQARYDIPQMNNIDMRITDVMLGEVLTTKVAVTGMTLTRQAASLVKISFDIKPNGLPELAKLPSIA